MKAKRVINAFSVLVLLTPWLCGQNPDELLGFVYLQNMGTSTSPGRHPYRFRQCEMRSLLQAGLEGTGAWRLAVAQWGAVTAVPVRQQAKVNLVIVPAGGTKRGQDFLPSQNFRQFSLWATRLDNCR